MTRSLLLALFALTLALPVALANTTIQLGPATVTTTSTDSGSACGGAGGSHSRDAHATLQLDAMNSLQADAAQYCDDNTWGHSNTTIVSAGRVGPGSTNYGPYGGIYWTTFSSSYWNTCGSGVFGAGANLQPGCPTLDGSGPPLLPPLP